MKEIVARSWRDDSGQGLIEYALIAALVAIGLTVALLIFQGSVGGGFNTVTSALDSPGGCKNGVPQLKNPNC